MTRQNLLFGTVALSLVLVASGSQAHAQGNQVWESFARDVVRDVIHGVQNQGGRQNQGGWQNQGRWQNQNGWQNQSGWPNQGGGWHDHHDHGRHGGEGRRYYPNHNQDRYYDNRFDGYSYQVSPYQSSYSSYSNGGISLGGSAPPPPRDNYSYQPIVISCPAEYMGQVNYRLNSDDYSMRAGQSQELRDDRRWEITFDRGAGAGTARYRLIPGSYEFRLKNGQWQLVTVN